MIARCVPLGLSTRERQAGMAGSVRLGQVRCVCESPRALCAQDVVATRGRGATRSRSVSLLTRPTAACRALAYTATRPIYVNVSLYVPSSRACTPFLRGKRGRSLIPPFPPWYRSAGSDRGNRNPIIAYTVALSPMDGRDTSRLRQPSASTKDVEGARRRAKAARRLTKARRRREG